MIGHIRGTLLDKTSNIVLVEAAGVGYEINLTMPAWFELSEVGTTVAIFTHLVVREDAQQLFGFRDDQEKTAFRELVKVSGIGPKVAQAILSSMDVNELAKAIANQDVLTMVKTPGIGKKTAERLLLELQDRVDRFTTDSDSLMGSSIALGGTDKVLQDAEQALLALGYSAADCKRLLKQVPADCSSVAQAVRIALRSVHN